MVAEDRTGPEELLRLVLEHKDKHGEKDAWALLTLALVCLEQMVRLIESRAATLPVAAPSEASAGAGKGLFDLLGALGPLMGAFKAPPRESSPAPPEAAEPVPSQDAAGTGAKEGPEEAKPEETRPGETRSGGVIKWDPRLVGGGRK